MSWLKAKDWTSGTEYSSLFHSGLGAISLRPRAPCARANSVSVSPSHEKSSRQRRSSMASLSSRLLRLSTTRKVSRSPATSPESSPPPSQTEKVVRPRPSSMFVHSTKEMSEPWSSGETLFKVEKYHKFSEGDQNASHVIPPKETYPCWTSRPLFVNLGDIDVNPTPPKGESFLSLSGSPDVPLQHPLPKRERLVSRQTVPISSHRSSLHYRTRDTKREKLDRPWMLEESSPELKAQEFSDDEDVSDLSLDHDAADWRQFHVDWLKNELTIQVPVNLHW
ncbi:hypothetical protein PAXINDRAFT_100116 [Paxillus involutus ATCC 200175]|uniref:Uncharacterized protein n=1 Tax=Paxillus involutus ATCC 200175 TaxID=664439 RepID=A0A0C9TFI4_PAXIN|nr:hypothetical protein PAXINDRAFT_100116 [Paxillus involutus ATCC 200175]